MEKFIFLLGLAILAFQNSAGVKNNIYINVIIKTQDSRLLYFLPETLVTVKWEDSSKTKNVASEEPPKKKKY